MQGAAFYLLRRQFFGCKITFVNNETVIEDFFRSLRVTLTNAFSYPKDHPYFIKSVESFKLKLEEAQSYLEPFKLGVGDAGILIDGKELNRKGFYDELARLLHQRKIKSIQINRGATTGEIIAFFSVISMAPKDISKGGGVNALLNKKNLENFIVEELDYSAFLGGEGQECSDIWGYMLRDAVGSGDRGKLNNFADNFGSLIKRANQEEIFKTDEIPANISDFLTSLKENNKEQFDKCSKEVFLWLLRNKKSIDQEKLEKLKLVFQSLNHDELSDLLLEGLYKEDNFDALSLELFSRISQQKNPPRIAENFLNKINAAERFSHNPRVMKRVKDLLSVSSQDDQMSAVYRKTLESLVKDISLEGTLVFDQKSLRKNYRYIVLNILAVDKEEEGIYLASEAVGKELEGALEDEDLDFFRDFYGLLVKQKEEGNNSCSGAEKKLSVFIENIILNQPLSPEKEFFLEMVSSASQDMNFYLDKIFNAEKTDRYVLILFLRFFPGNLEAFYARVKQRVHDIDFIFNLIDTLGQLNMPVTLAMLDNIYSTANELIKIGILKNMRKSRRSDTQFLLRQLDTDSPLLRKNLLSVLILNPKTSEAALELLFNVPSFCGRKNDLLIENMQIVSDLGIIEAARYIHDLSRRRFFWNRNLRNKARQILKGWDVK
jgi:hypothetical protein